MEYIKNRDYLTKIKDLGYVVKLVYTPLCIFNPIQPTPLYTLCLMNTEDPTGAGNLRAEIGIKEHDWIHYSLYEKDLVLCRAYVSFLELLKTHLARLEMTKDAPVPPSEEDDDEIYIDDESLR